MDVSEYVDDDVSCSRNEVPLAFDHDEIMGGLDSDMGFTKSCCMRALAHECLVVPVGMTIL